ncbi:MAG: flagellar basal body rod protein FlgB [Syntrophaceae bacterium]|nr:flagellar basal body rod protein FlgB [Syntrophaceae bacterium]
MDALFGKTIDMLSKMLDYRSKRHQLLTSNVANLDTPGYKSSDLEFNKNLERAIRSSGTLPLTTDHPGHMTGRTGGKDASYTVRREEGQASLDKEMARLAENQLQYNMTVEMLARKFRGIGNVVKETK